MPATLATFDAILQDFYLGPIQEQLNQEVLALELMEKVKVDWNGRQCIIPVHISRNDSAALGNAFVAEGGGLPTAGQQGYEDLQIRARFQYGRFSVTGPAIAAAKKGGTHTFISWVDSEMKKLVSDVRDAANKSSIFGGQVQGYIPMHGIGAGVNTAGAQVAGALAATDGLLVCQYDGSFNAFDGTLTGTAVNAANDATWVRVDLVRTDTFNAVDFVGVPVNNNFFVSAFNRATGTITISQSVNNAGAISWTTVNNTGNSSVTVMLNATQAVDSAGANAGAAPFVFANQPTGIFDNLTNPTHFTVTRNAADPAAVPAVAAAGQAPILRSKVITSFVSTPAVPATAAGGSRAPLTLTRIQQSIDELLTTSTTLQVDGSGKEPDLMLMNPLQRQSYVGLLQGTLATGAPAAPTQLYKDSSKATQGDGGFTGLSYGGMPMKISRDMPNGMIAFLKTDGWCITELQKPGFADLDGNILSRVVNADRWEGFYRWYYNIVCKRPNANIMMSGLTL
tara:strand:+ start:4886 stop:6412 length:1527 start_codon:yes stop_codon:yes gene_type:complete